MRPWLPFLNQVLTFNPKNRKLNIMMHFRRFWEYEDNGQICMCRWYSKWNLFNKIFNENKIFFVHTLQNILLIIVQYKKLSTFESRECLQNTDPANSLVGSVVNFFRIVSREALPVRSLHSAHIANSCLVHPLSRCLSGT